MGYFKQQARNHRGIWRDVSFGGKVSQRPESGVLATLKQMNDELSGDNSKAYVVDFEKKTAMYVNDEHSMGYRWIPIAA